MVEPVIAGLADRDERLRAADAETCWVRNVLLETRGSAIGEAARHIAAPQMEIERHIGVVGGLADA